MSKIFNRTVSDPEIGKRLAVRVKKYLPPAEEKSESSFLGLGSGSGRAELAFAQELDIDPGKVVLLDKKFPKKVRERLAAAFPELSLEEEGIFTYLQKETEQKFHFVTAISLEYLLRKNELQLFIPLLRKTLEPGAVVVIAPLDVNLPQVWQENGFTLLEDFGAKVGGGIYRYDGQN